MFTLFFLVEHGVKTWIPKKSTIQTAKGKNNHGKIWIIGNRPSNFDNSNCIRKKMILKKFGFFKKIHPTLTTQTA